MALFGWLMFLLGAAMLLFMGVVGLDAGLGGNRVGNLPGILVGAALMISGSIFAAVGALIDVFDNTLATKTNTKESELVEEYKSYRIFKAGKKYLVDRGEGQGILKLDSLADAKTQIDILTVPQEEIIIYKGHDLRIVGDLCYIDRNIQNYCISLKVAKLVIDRGDYS